MPMLVHLALIFYGQTQMHLSYVNTYFYLLNYPHYVNLLSDFRVGREDE